MSWAALSDLFNAREVGASKRKPAAKEKTDSTWNSIIRDIQSCGLRNQTDDVPQSQANRPAPTKNRPHVAPTNEVAQVQKVEEIVHSARVHVPDSELVLGPFSDTLPHALVERLERLLSKEDPYVEREITERASGNLRIQFLKQCKKGQKDRCAIIWGALSNSERRDFYRVAASAKGTSPTILLNIIEPDTDAGESSLDDFESRSDFSGSQPGSASSVSGKNKTWV